MRATSLGAEKLARIRQAAAGGHPRLHLAADDRPSILDRAAAGSCREMAERLRAKCDAYLDREHQQFLDLDTYDSDDLLARPGQFVLSRIMQELSFAGWLWPDTGYAGRAAEIVLRRAREALMTDVGGNPVFSHHRSPLGIGITGCPLAWSADLIMPTLATAERQAVVAHVRDYYLDYAKWPFFERDRLHAPGFNKTVAGMCAIGELALLVAADLADDELDWAVSESLRSALAYAREAMDDDGGTYEGPGYGSHCLARVISFGEALRRHGIADIAVYEPLRRHAHWLISLLVANGGTVSLGDSHGPENFPAELLLVADWWDDPVIRWGYLRGLGRGDHRRAPYGDDFALWGSTLPQQLAWYRPAARVADPDSAGWPRSRHAAGYGAITLRTGWQDDDLVAVLTGCGRRATAAAHIGAEAGALGLWFRGHELLHDPGYGYASADAHSLCQVADVEPVLAGGNARFGGRSLRYADGEFAALGSVDVAQLLDCRWAVRDVVLVRGERPYLVVADDVNYRSDWAEYDWFWQVHPAAVAELPTADSPWAKIQHGPTALSIASFLPAADAYPRAHSGVWHAESYRPSCWHDRGDSAFELRRLRYRVAGYNGLLLSILVPHGLTAELPTITRIACAAPGIAVRIDWAASVDVVVFAPYNRFLQTDLTDGSGRLAVVGDIGGAATGWCLIDGYALRCGDRERVPPQSRAGEFIGSLET